MNWLNEIKNIPIWKKYSQYGEESIAEFIFENIGTTNKFYVEFGAGNGLDLSNTFYLKEWKGWNGVLMDSENETVDVNKEFITKGNICNLFEKYEVPDEFDFLSVDMDGNDYWVLDAILNEYKPRVIVAEFNCSLDDREPMTIKYSAEHTWQRDNYFGFNLSAGKSLAKKHGYSLVHQNNNVNAWLIRNDLIEGLEIPNVTCERICSFPISERTDWVKL